MKLNNKGFAISSIMYIILILAVILISVTLALLSSRKLVLDKIKQEVMKDIYPMCMLISGQEKTIGAKYECDFGDGKRKFYILELGSNKVEGSTLKDDEVALILEGNYDTTTQAWCDQNGPSPNDNSCAADGLTSKLDEIAEAWKELEREQIVLPSALQIIVANDPSKNTVESTSGIQSWLYNWPGNANYNGSYWTSTPYAGDSDLAWFVYCYGGVHDDYVDNGDNFGVRPVVNIKL